MYGYSNRFSEGSCISIFGMGEKKGFAHGQVSPLSDPSVGDVSANLLLDFSAEKAGEPRSPFRYSL